MISRWQEGSVRRGLATRRGVHLTGARQCGKTTLAEFISAGGMRHLTLDDEVYLKAAKSSPSEFVDRIDGRTLVIDEIQKAPSLLDAIKIKLDHSNEKGQYLLTGSSNLRFMKSVRDSLAGRLKTVRLRTLALGEIIGGKGDFLDRAFARDFIACEKLDKRDIIRLAFEGGYPEARELEAPDRRDWFEGYIADLIVKDIQDVAEIRKVEAVRKTVEWLLAYTSKFFDLKDLCSQAQISRPTLESYLEALKALYIVDEVEPWSKSDYARIGKRSKYFASDPSLVANVLGWNEERTFFDEDANGKLVETWVHHELAALIDKSVGYRLSHYRDSDKKEIDFIVERDDGAIVGLEVKAGSVGSSDFKHIRWFKENLVKGAFTGIVLYSGRETLSFGEGLYAVPLAELGV